MKPFCILAASLILAACASKSPVSDVHEKPLTAKFVKIVKPNYPVYAYVHRITGKVRISFDVGVDGKVSELRFLSSEPDHLFDDEVVRTVSQWEFRKNDPQTDQRMNLIFSLTSNLTPLKEGTVLLPSRK